VTKYRDAGNCRVDETTDKGRGRKTWKECLKVDMKMLGLVNDDAHSLIEISGII